MRTTIDLPEDLHRIAAAIARDDGTTLSATVARLLRAALQGGPIAAETSERTGLTLLRLGHPVTSEDVRSLEDDS